jgi:hypothetical protein
MTAPPAPLPRDLQGRLDVILAKPLLRRAPALAQAIEILVRNAYERHPPSVLTADQRALLDELTRQEREDFLPVLPPIGNSDTGSRGYEQIVPFETGAPWRSSAETEWDASRGYENKDGVL